MASLAFAAGLTVQSSNSTDIGQSLGPRDNKGPSISELESIELADYGHLSSRPNEQPGSSAKRFIQADAQSPGCVWQDSRTPNELERREPPTPKQGTATPVLPSFWYPAMNKWRILAASLIYFGNGMSDSAPGALIPYIEDWYRIGYAIVSLIWITNAVGFILSAVFNDAICSRLGRAKSLMLSETFMIAAYVVIACAPPFPVVVVAYCVLGFGNALNLALNNVFCSNLSDSTVVLGIAHGSYGVGGIVAPIAATAMVSNGVFWARFYLITIGVRVLCFFMAAWSFWNYEKEETSRATDNLHQIANKQVATELGEPSKLKMLGRALRNKTTLIGALFIFSYQGAEVSESGWFISYLISYRHGNPAKVGYVTSGFWAGITIGRFVLTHIAHRVGEKSFVFAMGLGVIAFQVMAWQIRDVIGDAVSVAILGLFLGPVYPCAQTIFSRLIPQNLQVISIGFISSAGSSGGAIVPFLTGLIAQVAGTYVLHPICIGFYMLMLGCWTVLPKMKKQAAE